MHVEFLTIQTRVLGVVGDDRGEIGFVQQIFFPIEVDLFIVPARAGQSSVPSGETWPGKGSARHSWQRLWGLFLDQLLHPSVSLSSMKQSLLCTSSSKIPYLLGTARIGEGLSVHIAIESVTL